MLTFRGDLEFWGLKDTLMESCCRDKYEADLLHVLQVGLFLSFFASFLLFNLNFSPSFPQEMEGQCFDMQEDVPEIFSNNCLGR